MDPESCLEQGGQTVSDPKIQRNEFGIIENPYYGDAEDIVINPTRKSSNIVDLNDTQCLTATENIYYEM